MQRFSIRICCRWRHADRCAWDQKTRAATASPAPFRERGRRHELDAPEGGYTTSPFGNTFAPLSYGVGGTGRWF